MASRSHENTPHDPPLSRREMLSRSGLGFGMLGLTGVLAADGVLAPEARAASASGALAPRNSHFVGKARQVVHLFMNGGPSQVDTFDPKPLLDKYHGQPLPSANLRTERKTGAAMRSPFKFARYGQSGIEVSELFAKTAAHVDDMCVIRSMMADVPNHEPSLLLMNCGDGRLPRPSFGSWVTYGLGSENQNLPGFVVLGNNQGVKGGPLNWSAGFLPSAHQGTLFRAQGNPI
ncbi:MAG: DUF1501 domain-containing protein, partial [Pirellulales bacterium]